VVPNFSHITLFQIFYVLKQKQVWPACFTVAWILLNKVTFVPGFVGVLLGVLNQHLEEPPNVRKSALLYFLDHDHFEPQVQKDPNRLEKQNLKKPSHIKGKSLKIILHVTMYFATTPLPPPASSTICLDKINL
jgi:hypothetical protein